MLGIGRGVTLALVGWLWADLLLGLFVIFLAANASTLFVEKQSSQGIDPNVIPITVAVDGRDLLSSDPAAVERQQREVANAVQKQMDALAPGKKVALVLAFGSHERAGDGDRLAQLATDPLKNTVFAGAVVNNYHEIVSGDIGTRLDLEIYVYQ